MRSIKNSPNYGLTPIWHTCNIIARILRSHSASMCPMLHDIRSIHFATDRLDLILIHRAGAQSIFALGQCSQPEFNF